MTAIHYFILAALIIVCTLITMLLYDLIENLIFIKRKDKDDFYSKIKKVDDLESFFDEDGFIQLESDMLDKAYYVHEVNKCERGLELLNESQR